jgi:uncharacterized Zn-finger protein
MCMCIQCNKTFKLESALVSYVSFSCNKEMNKRKYKCNVCFKSVSRSDSLKRHKEICQNKKNYKCNLCFKDISRKDVLIQHKKICKKNKKMSNIVESEIEVINKNEIEVINKNEIEVINKNEIEVFNVDLSNNVELFSYYEWY